MKKNTRTWSRSSRGGIVLSVLLAVAALAQTAGEVRFHGPLARVLTPNGDRVNDIAYFCFENPQDSEISGKIYGLLGGEVAQMTGRRDRTVNLGSACPAPVIRAQFVTWEPGASVRSGLYVYRIQAGDRVFTGTLVVFR